jgi:hypothetical protein
MLMDYKKTEEAILAALAEINIARANVAQNNKLFAKLGISFGKLVECLEAVRKLQEDMKLPCT